MVGTAYLVAVEGPSAGLVWTLPLGADRSLGRSLDSDVLLLDKGVSRRHAVLRWMGDRATVTEAPGRNGVKVERGRLPGGTLAEGALVKIGGATRLELCDEARARELRRQICAASDDDGQARQVADSKWFLRHLEAALAQGALRREPVAVIYATFARLGTDVEILLASALATLPVDALVATAPMSTVVAALRRTAADGARAAGERLRGDLATRLAPAEPPPLRVGVVEAMADDLEPSKVVLEAYQAATRGAAALLAKQRRGATPG